MTSIKIRIIQIIRAGTRLISNSFKFDWNPKFIDFRFWIPAKIEAITDKHGTSADYLSLLCMLHLKTLLEFLGDTYNNTTTNNKNNQRWYPSRY